MGFVASAFAVDACSSDDATTGETADASDASQRDVAIVYPDAEETCDRDADILANVKDAEISDGASTTGICVACMKQKCAGQLRSCAEDCVCQGIMSDAIECYLTTQSLGCLGRLTNYLVTQDTRARALTLGGCAQSDCNVECAVDGGTMPEASTDSSTDASGD